MQFSSVIKAFILIALLASEFGDTTEVKGGMIQTRKFRRAKGRRLVTSDPALNLGTTPRAPQCLTFCSSHPSCVSVNYHRKEGLCLGRNSSVGLIGNQLVPDSQYDFHTSWPVDVKLDNWVMAFRAQKEINASIKSSYLSSGVWHDDELLTLDPMYYSLDLQGVPAFHYRSRYLDQWTSSNIKRVSFSLYKNGSLVKDMVFDATDSNSTNWFSADRLLISPWTDLLNETTQYFSFEGSTALPRRLSVIKTETDNLLCSPTLGWLMVTDDRTNICRFEKTRKFPRFQYAEGLQMVDFSTEFDQPDKGMMDYADVLAIFVLTG